MVGRESVEDVDVCAGGVELRALPGKRVKVSGDEGEGRMGEEGMRKY